VKYEPKMSNIEGFCRLCGNYSKLSFEHIPPRRAFNDQQQAFQTMQDLLGNRSRTKFRKGLGQQSICERCNNLTGAWYGEAYVSWAKQGLVWLNRLSENNQFSLPYHIKPLNVLKQIVVMSLAMASDAALDYHSEVRQFVLNREQKYLPPYYRVYAYLTADGSPRFASGMAVMNIQTGASNYIDSEIALPPFGYCVTSSKRKQNSSLAEEQDLCEIGWLSNFDYNIWTTIFLRLPLLETHMPFPLDYRSKAEVEEHNRKSVLDSLPVN